MSQLSNPAEQAARDQLIAVIMRGLKAYAPDEAETYGHDEAEMIADYVAPYVAQVIEQARREEQERADVIVRGLCDRLRVSEHDRIAYRGALGYPCPGDHNGRLTDGTIPHCGLCPSRAEQARREEREACAKIALHWYDLPDEITDQAEPHTVEGMIAAAIRARAQEEQS